MRHPDCKASLLAWFKHAEEARWRIPEDVLRENPNARIIGDSRVIFNIMKNSYRLVVRIEYQRWQIYIRFAGTHAEYDKINAQNV